MYGICTGKGIQFHAHRICLVLNLIPSSLQHPVQIRIAQRRDLEDARRFPAPVDLLAVRDFLLQRQHGAAKLLDTVGPVRVKIGKPQNPAVVKLHLVRRPGIQGKIFDRFDFCMLHLKNLGKELCFRNPYGKIHREACYVSAILIRKIPRECLVFLSFHDTINIITASKKQGSRSEISGNLQAQNTNILCRQS